MKEGSTRCTFARSSGRGAVVDLDRSGQDPLWTSNDELVYIDPQALNLTAARLELGSTVR